MEFILYGIKKIFLVVKIMVQGGTEMPRRGENIRKRKDGRWEGRYRVADMDSGKAYFRSVYAKSYREVKDKLTAAKKESLKGKTKDSIVSIREAASEWLQAMESKKKYSTYIKYLNVYHSYVEPVLGDMPINEITQESFNALFTENSEKSNSTLKSISCVVNQILRFSAVKYDMPVPALTGGRGKSVNRPVEVLTKTEQSRLIRYLYQSSDIYKIGILLCLSTGLRLGEICALKWEDIDFDNKLLHVNRTVQRIAVKNQEAKTILFESEPKSCFSKREIPVTDELIKILLLSRKPDGYVLEYHKPMEPRTYQNKYAGYLKAAGIRKTNFHVLRHTFATNCIDTGTDIKSLSEILGHSDVKITLNRYVHPTMEMKRQHMNSLAEIYGQYVGQIVV